MHHLKTMSTKQQKELEAQLHEQVYNNIFLLTLKHAPPDDFVRVFRREMFVKNNKAGFQHVVRYLLDVLDPVRLPQKITVWPIYDSRGESQFRNEVMKYLNELNSLYEDADIPTVLVSHLVGPGGHKFIKFMLKLTQLVVYEELQKNPKTSKEMLHRIAASKSPELTRSNMQRLRGKTRAIDHGSRALMEQFEATLMEKREKAEVIMREQAQLNAELPNLERKLAELQQTVQQQGNDVNFETLQAEIDRVGSFDAKLKHSRDLVILLCSNDLCLDGDSTLGGLNLLDSLREFNELLFKRHLEIKALTKRELAQSVDKYTSLNEKMQTLANSLGDVYMKLRVMLANLNPQESGVKELSSSY